MRFSESHCNNTEKRDSEKQTGRRRSRERWLHSEHMMIKADVICWWIAYTGRCEKNGRDRSYSFWSRSLEEWIAVCWNQNHYGKNVMEEKLTMALLKLTCLVRFPVRNQILAFREAALAGAINLMFASMKKMSWQGEWWALSCLDDQMWERKTTMTRYGGGNTKYIFSRL